MFIDRDAPNRKWYAIRVASNFEKPTAQALRGKSIEELLPLCQQRRNRHGRLRPIERPLFPGYVFGRFDIRERVSVLTIPGVVHIVSAGRTPVPIDDDEVAALRRIEDSRLTVEPWPYLKVGQRVWIERGPLRGLEGIVLKFKGAYWLIASVTLLERSVAVQIDRESVRPAAKAICPAGLTLAVGA
jgi:transcription antitermination factor NusG